MPLLSLFERNMVFHYNLLIVNVRLSQDTYQRKSKKKHIFYVTWKIDLISVRVSHYKFLVTKYAARQLQIFVFPIWVTSVYIRGERHMNQMNGLWKGTARPLSPTSLRATMVCSHPRTLQSFIRFRLKCLKQCISQRKRSGKQSRLLESLCDISPRCSLKFSPRKALCANYYLFN